MEGRLWIAVEGVRQELALGVKPDEVVELPPPPPDESVPDVRAMVAGVPAHGVPAEAGEYEIQARGVVRSAAWEVTAGEWELLTDAGRVALRGTGEKDVATRTLGVRRA